MIWSIKFYISRFNLEMPIYVNMVRDPVERVISWYYYIRSVRKLKQHSERKWADLFLRAPWYFVERKRVFPELPLPNPNWLKKVKQMKKTFIPCDSFSISGLWDVCEDQGPGVPLSAWGPERRLRWSPETDNVLLWSWRVLRVSVTMWAPDACQTDPMSQVH